VLEVNKHAGLSNGGFAFCWLLQGATLLTSDILSRLMIVQGWYKSVKLLLMLLAPVEHQLLRVLMTEALWLHLRRLSPMEVTFMQELIRLELAISVSTLDVNTYRHDDQSHPCVAHLPGGGFAVAWDSNGQDGSS